jgi:hypothetical protein
MITFFLILSLYASQAQELKKQKLNNGDIKKGVWAYR